MPLHRLRPGLSRALSVSPASSLSCPARTQALLAGLSAVADRTSRRPTSRRPVSGPSRRPVSGPSRRPVSGQRLPAFLVGTPAPAPGSVLALAAQSPSESSAAVGLRPGSAYGAGPLIRRFEASGARQLLESVWHGPLLAIHCQWLHSLALRPEGRQAACAGQRPASVSPGDWRSQLAPHMSSVAPAVSAWCWLTGLKLQPVPGAIAQMGSRRHWPFPTSKCPGNGFRLPAATCTAT